MISTIQQLLADDLLLSPMYMAGRPAGDEAGALPSRSVLCTGVCVSGLSV